MASYYKNIFELLYTHGFGSISELESLIPYERDIYVDLINDRVEKKREEERTRELERKALTESGMF